MSQDLPAAESLSSKGFTLLGALAFVEERFGIEARWKLLRSLDEGSRQVLLSSILPSGWYPFAVQVALYEAIDKALGDGDLSLCWEIGRFTCDYEMSRIHKVFVRIASLDLWVRSAGLMWGRYYSHGALEVEGIGDVEGRVRVVDFNPISKAFCYDFGGWLQRTLELNGREQATVEHAACVLDGDDACRYVGRWLAQGQETSSEP